ncbi:efflux RND transporter periplasmic adaptor subunit [Tardiphaga sp. 42S5]|uniref:efflux RND transporter periplasmic adaptor subunit n=1 Tax=Tardiphaga sp. 42S5 TaxID=1404799 RepID=UPI002A59D39B|nr:efflux RND transporter periplasmic adaptor subunit [Tardiphaga sp. 42S5]WPO43976.1 efflux RND transporter periplasmic adaptor subunit [Tardiphaga sp. 42S5]
MERKRLLVACTVVALASGGVAALLLTEGASSKPQEIDPRSAKPLVKVVEAKSAGTAERGYTGSIGARVQSNLGFRVPGKIVQRYVDVGQQVKQGQPLLRIDENDLRLALTAKRNAAAAARAMLVQATADEQRYSTLVQSGFATRQRYEQAKAAFDSATAQAAATEAEARVAENEAAYSTLTADVDGTVVETLGEPGQVVAAGQTVVRLAQAGPREAIVSLPENVRPSVGSHARAVVYGTEKRSWSARLRTLSDSADALTRTYEARYVLEGDAAEAPLGATVTIRLASAEASERLEIPVGAIFDDGSKVGVWSFDADSATVHFKPIKLLRVGEETALVTGIRPGEPVVALGAHLLRDGASVRTKTEKADAR